MHHDTMLNYRMKHIIYLSIILLLLGTPVAAQDAGQQQMRDGTVIIGADDVIDDDVSIQAATIIINGTINGDVDFFAGTIYIPGQINGNLSGYGGNVQIDGTIEGNAELFGGNILLGPQSSITGNLITGGGTVYLRGNVGETATIEGGSVEIDNTARIEGDLRYSAERFTNNGATIAGSISQDVGDTFDDALSFLAVPAFSLSVYGIIVNAVFGIILLFVLPGLSKRIRERGNDRPLRAIGIGILSMIFLPLVLVIMLLTVVGVPLAILGLGLLILAAWMGNIYGKYIVGRAIIERFDKEHEPVAMVIGVIAVGLATLLPVLGGLIDLIVLLFGFGLLVQVIVNKHPRLPDDAYQ